MDSGGVQRYVLHSGGKLTKMDMSRPEENNFEVRKKDLHQLSILFGFAWEPITAAYTLNILYPIFGILPIITHSSNQL